MVGVVGDDGPVLASDSRWTEWWTGKYAEGDLDPGKLVQVAPGVVFGVTGDGRGVNVLRHWVDVPRYHEDDDPERYLTRELWRAIVAGSIAMGVTDKESNRVPWDMLAIVHGGLFCLYGNGFCQAVRHWFALGSGGADARAALESLRGAPMSARERAQQAVRVAIAQNVYCGGEVQMWPPEAVPPEAVPDVQLPPAPGGVG